MKSDQEQKIKVRYFSWLEYFGLLVALSLFSALPAIMYGVELGYLWGHYTIWYLIYWAIIAGICCLITAYQKYSKFDKPMRVLSEATSRVANGDFSVYLKPLHTTDKADYLDAMFLDFNRMVEELGSIETLKTDFLSNVSHEIKTPLAIIQNYAEALQKEDLTPVQHQDYAETIVNASKRLSALITSILKLNKLEKQTICPITEPYDLCKQLCDCALNFEDLWEQKGIEFVVDLEDYATIEADENLMALVWNNLLSNAIKFTPTGGTITLKQTSSEKEVIVSLADTGSGMSEETMKHSFDKFYQGDTSHGTEGNGLGLALALRVLQLMDGSITVSSILGKGSTFTVRIPTAKHKKGKNQDE